MRTLISVMSGVLLGLSMTIPQGALLAWIGIFLLAIWIHTSPPDGRFGPSLLVSGAIQYTIALHWLPGVALAEVGPWGAAVAIVASLLLGAGTRLPICAIAAAPVRTRVPLALSLPFAWTAGEWAKDLVVGCTLGDLLYAFADEPILGRILFHLGWWPTTAYIVFTAAILCTLLLSSKPNAWLYDATLAALCITQLMPGPVQQPWPFDGIAVVSLKNASALPDVDYALRQLGTPELVVWPESVLRLPRGTHGTFTGSSRYDVAGAIQRAADGDRNVVAVFHDGAMVAARAKHWFAPYESGYVRGDAEVYLDLGGHSVMALICFEALGPRAAAEIPVGIEAIVVVASDRPLHGDPTALLQMQRAAALLSAAYGVPVFRASVGGEALTVLPGGPVISTQRGTARYSVLVVEREASFDEAYRPASR